MKAMFNIGLLLLCLGMGIWTIAQGNTNTYEFPESAVSISFPTKWTLTESDRGFIELSTSGLSLTVYDPVALELVATLDDVDSVEDALRETALQMLAEEAAYDEAAVTVDTLDDREIARLDIEHTDDIDSLIMVTMTDESFGVIHIRNSQSNLTTIETLLNDIITSFDKPVNSIASEDTPCIISTTQSSTVQVRVGPGTNRTVISFLPANRDFAAISKTIVDDGNLWFQLNKDEAAPNKSVNQTWVAADSVDQTGNCDAVVDGLAPPIVPIVQAAPNGQPDSDSVVSSGTGTCYVSTTSANTVPVRHGPETRRSMAVFLPANTDYEVIAKTISADGSLWFELNKDEVSYGILANDLWVAATSVNQTGNCAGDGGTAPTLVPFIQHETGGNDIYGDDRDDRAYF